MVSYKPVTAALRVLEVLSSVNRLDGKATVGSIHYQTGIDKSTIVRMLETLISAGYVVRNEASAIYRVTGKSMSLSSSYDRKLVFVDILTPILGEFREDIGWPSDVALLDHDAMVVVETSRASGPLSFNRSTGYRAPLLGTSLGLAYIAYCSPERQAEILDCIPDDGAPWNDLKKDREAFSARMHEVREKGFATMDAAYSQREYSNRIFSIGVPIRNEERVFASINVIYLKQTMSPERAQDMILPKLVQVSEQMSTALAYRAEPG